MHPLTALQNAGAISQAEADAGFWYATQIQRFNITRAQGEQMILETIRRILWPIGSSAHAYRIVLGIAGLAEQWRCVTELTTNSTTLHPKTPKQIEHLKHGLQRIAQFRDLKIAA